MKNGTQNALTLPGTSTRGTRELSETERILDRLASNTTSTFAASTLIQFSNLRSFRSQCRRSQPGCTTTRTPERATSPTPTPGTWEVDPIKSEAEIILEMTTTIGLTPGTARTPETAATEAVTTDGRTTTGRGTTPGTAGTPETTVTVVAVETVAAAALQTL